MGVRRRRDVLHGLRFGHRRRLGGCAAARRARAASTSIVISTVGARAGLRMPARGRDEARRDAGVEHDGRDDRDRSGPEVQRSKGKKTGQRHRVYPTYARSPGHRIHPLLAAFRPPARPTPSVVTSLRSCRCKRRAAASVARSGHSCSPSRLPRPPQRRRAASAPTTWNSRADATTDGLASSDVTTATRRDRRGRRRATATCASSIRARSSPRRSTRAPTPCPTPTSAAATRSRAASRTPEASCSGAASSSSTPRIPTPATRSLGCVIPEANGCTGGVYTPPANGSLTFECLDCFGGGGRRPVGLRPRTRRARFRCRRRLLRTDGPRRGRERPCVRSHARRALAARRARRARGRGRALRLRRTAAMPG